VTVRAAPARPGRVTDLRPDDGVAARSYAASVDTPLDLKLNPVVRELGARLLGDLDLLTDRLVERIHRHEPLYAAADAVSIDDLRASVRTNLERSMQALSGRIPEGGDWSDRAIETGRLRARQGMPLETVLRAYRLGGSVIWEGLVEAARQDPETFDPDRLLDAAAPIWQLIDGHSTMMSEAYRIEESRLRSRDLRRRQALLEALVEGRGADPAFSRQAERTLGIPAEGPLLCVVALTDVTGSEPLKSPYEALGSRGIDSVWLVRPATEVGLVDLSEVDGEQVVATLRPRARGRVGVAPVIPGFAEVSRAYRLAELAARTLPEDAEAVVTLEDRLPEALVANCLEVTPHLLRHTVEPLLALPEAERRTLLATVEAVLEHDGSPSRAAEVLYCHRNTVTYRLQRITELTGRSLATPRDKLLWTLGLAALRQGTAPPAD
jgi:hypothetical protein